MLSTNGLTLSPMPAAHLAAGAITGLGDLTRSTGARRAVIVTDPGIAATPILSAVLDALGDLPAAVFSGVHANPTTDDIALGAEVAIDHGAQVVVAVGGGSAIDAAKGIAVAAVNPQRGRDLDYRSGFANPALPLLAVPTTAGTGAETNAFGVVTDVASHRKFYVGHASALPRAAVLDPELTVGLPPGQTAATGMDALTHALESYSSVRANPWSDGIALQVIRIVSRHLPRAYRDGSDLEARAQMLLAAHMAGVGMAATGLGICHGIGHPLGGRFDLAHGVALTMLLPHVLRFNLPVRLERTADIAFALGVGETDRSVERNAEAAIDAVAALAGEVGLTGGLGDHGVGADDFDLLAADALADEVMANTPRFPTADDVRAILSAAVHGAGR
ncbi:iron-containing alcohol dehydrogenase [Planosporangium thailandense]|uniref:Iron-containing alcohol dehydrogenase n=1 Tax=Planosporangium thailandense TaxID=765197 RepID=A0ABX0Y5H2_9ACTN|nr:iron-containing alcohol dehydrogenase [Planosporangium thailandense]NJC73667.1 iron-containing alcohol dehydrogenase [Planosporangium thailandense]